MRTSWTVAVTAGCLVVAIAACSGGAVEPPLEALPLRDALGADPAVILAMTEDAKRDLAARFERERIAHHDDESFARDPEATPASDVRNVDAVHAAEGRDALVAGAIDGKADRLAVRPLADDVQTAEAAPLPPLEGALAKDTADVEARALQGRAGAIVATLLKGSGATRLVRVTAWPVGAVARGEVVYVNASWLVALGSQERATDAGLRLAVASAAPMALRGNPYLTYSSVEACANDVTQRCSVCLSTGGCDDHASLADLPDGKSECAFLAQDPNRAAELCALALMSIASVATCVQNDSGCSIPSTANTSQNLGGASAFLANATCVASLDACLSGTTRSTTPTGDGGKVIDLTVNLQTGGGCSDPFSSCSSACKSLGDSCKSGSCGGSSGKSCGSCGGSCSSCNSGSGSGGSCDSCGSKGGGGSSGGGSSSGNSCKCETQDGSPLPPLGTLAWLLAPLGALLFRGRRVA